MNALEIADDHAKVAIGRAVVGVVRMIADGGDGHVRLAQLNAPECKG